MKINAADLRNKPGSSVSLVFNEEFPDFDLGGEQIKFQTPVKVEVKVTNTSRLLSAIGSIASCLALKCSRCLKPMTHQVETEFEENFCHAEDLDALGLDPEDEDLEDRYTIYEGDVIDLQPMVLENIIWVLPMKTVCRDDCRGLCPKCGQDLNEGACQCRQEDVDPRLEVLRKLLPEQPTNAK